MSDSDEARRQRAAERSARVTIRRVGFDERDAEEPRVAGAAGIELAAQLTRAAWALSGRPFPRYTREETPYAFVPSADRS